MAEAEAEADPVVAGAGLAAGLLFLAADFWLELEVLLDWAAAASSLQVLRYFRGQKQNHLLWPTMKVENSAISVLELVTFSAAKVGAQRATKRRATMTDLMSFI